MLRQTITLHLLLCFSIVLAACQVTPGLPGATPTPPARLKVGVVIDSDAEDDNSFMEYTLKGAQKAAEEAGLDFTYTGSPSVSDYERAIESLIGEGADLVVTVGFRMGNATVAAAQRHPEIKFAILDNAYYPGSGCPQDVADCYSAAGGLTNVTSLMFAEDEVGYLAGVLAGCMTKTGVVASVAAMEIPPVVRYVGGFQNGARSARATIVTLNRYIPDFNDQATGQVVGQAFINQHADVIFGLGGSTGNGGLSAAMEAQQAGQAGIMAIGVDVDQYFTYQEVRPVLLTSAMKNVDVAAASAVKDFAAGQLAAGIRSATLANGGVGLAPYHDWESRVPQACKDKVEAARQAIIADPALTGAK